MRRANHRDAIERSCVETARAVGASDIDTSRVGDGAPDRVFGFRGETFLVEFKNPGEEQQLRPSQVVFHKSWRGTRIHVISSPEQLLAMFGLTSH